MICRIGMAGQPIRRAALAACIAAALSAAARPGLAEDYPNRPITVLVPLAAGGAMDIIVRTMAPKLSERLGTPVLVENRTGGGTVLAANDVAHGTPDGYTLLDAPGGTLTTNVTLYKTLSYDPVKDFIPLALYCRVPFVLVSNPALPFETIPELIAYAKDNPGKLAIARREPAPCRTSPAKSSKAWPASTWCPFPTGACRPR
jgi:tripartite-type tricarboxylate transporter receptor subunit TctC